MGMSCFLPDVGQWTLSKEHGLLTSLKEFLLCSTIFAQAQVLDLDDNWQMQSTILVKDDANTICSQDFKTFGWYPTKPGWTVLNSLIKNGVYPDMRIGMNNYEIPDISDSFNRKHNLERFSHLPDKQNPWTSPW